MFVFFTKFCVELRKELSSYSFKMKTLLDISQKDSKEDLECQSHNLKKRSLSKTSMDEGVSIGTNITRRSTQERNNLLLVDFIKSEK